jgi:hypothetical protein
MKTLRLKRIEYTNSDGETRYFSFSDMFVKSQNIKNSLADYLKDLIDEENGGPANLKQKLIDYYRGDGWSTFNTLWNIPYQTENNPLPYKDPFAPDTDIKNTPAGKDIVNSFPKIVDTNINNKLSEIKKEFLKDVDITPILHPALQEPYMKPTDVQIINPEFPPFYNRYKQYKAL